MKNGEINYLGNWDDSCFFVQKDKCGYFGIDRTMISDLKGEKSLIASSKFINEPQYYLGRGGADGNPESVYIIDNSAYFAHKSLGQVFKASGGGAGVQVISDINMRSWFKDVFEMAVNESQVNGEDVRVVGGYDPMKQEYLLTVLRPQTYGLITDPFIPEIEGPPPPPPPPPVPAPEWDICKWYGGTETMVNASVGNVPPNWFQWHDHPSYVTVADVATEIYGGEPGPF